MFCVLMLFLNDSRFSQNDSQLDLEKTTHQFAVAPPLNRPPSPKSCQHHQAPNPVHRWWHPKQPMMCASQGTEWEVELQWRATRLQCELRKRNGSSKGRVLVWKICSHKVSQHSRESREGHILLWPCHLMSSPVISWLMLNVQSFNAPTAPFSLKSSTISPEL